MNTFVSWVSCQIIIFIQVYFFLSEDWRVIKNIAVEETSL